MDPKHKGMLTSNRLTLVRDLIVNDELLSVLRAENVITEEQGEKIQAKPTAMGKVSFFLDILPRRGKRAFGGFIKALNETQQKHLVTLLCPNGDVGDVRHDGLDLTDLADSYWSKNLDELKDEINRCDGRMKLQVLPVKGDFCLSLRQQSDVYAIRPDRKKLAVIINNKYFSVTRLSTREGSDNDVDNFGDLLNQLNFEVLKKDNLTVKEIKQELEDARQKLKSGLYDVFVCCIMSHGAKGVVHGVDGMELSITSEILGCFSDQNCPDMVGKPKLFFLQACQGNTVTNSADSTDARPEVRDPGDSIWNNPDILLALATAEGFEAYRDQYLGSCFIRTIVYVFSKRACRDHLSDLLTQVCNILSRFLANCEYSQITERRDSLSKKMYFL